MSVIVKGMDMPKMCKWCKVWPMCWDEEPASNMIKSICPLIHLPSEHGRLIERDLLCDEIEGLMQYVRTHRPHNTELTAEEVLQIIRRQPIIVTAERSGS